MPNLGPDCSRLSRSNAKRSGSVTEIGYFRIDATHTVKANAFAKMAYEVKFWLISKGDF